MLNISVIELYIYLRMIKGTKLDVAFLNMSINTWYIHYFAIDITFSSIRDQRLEFKFITECVYCSFTCNCL